jgi:hypothetical protein
MIDFDSSPLTSQLVVAVRLMVLLVVDLRLVDLGT